MPDTSPRWSPKKRSTRDPAFVEMATAEARNQSATPGLQAASAQSGPRASTTQHGSVYHERVPLIRRGERESVEGFMWDKQRGQRALQKRQQIREDVHVYATEQALETSLQRQGVHLHEDDIVLDEHQAFEDPHFAAKLPVASHAESHSRRRSQLTRRSTGISSMRLHNLRASQRNVLGGSKEPDDGRASEQSWDIDDGDLDSSVFGGDDQDFLTAETLRTQAEEKKRLAQEERDLRQAQKERAEKIFFFYEQVDQVVARIANTLSTVNKSEMHFAMKLGDKFVNDPSIEASKDIKSSRTSLMQLLGPGDESVKPQGPPAVSFWTEEEAEEFRLTKESLEKLTASINVSTFSESLSEVGEWVHGRRKQSMAEEKEFYTLMKEVEEQEVEAEGASRSVRLMLREKEQRAESKLQRFGDALHKIKTKGKQLNALLARYDADAVALQSQQTQETIAVLESQIAIMRARVLEADGKLASAVPSKGENQEIEDKLRAEQSRLDLASAEVLEELDRIQAKNAVLIKQVAASGDVLHSLENIEQQVQLQVAFREKAREAYGRNQNQRLEMEDDDDEEKENEEDKGEEEEEQGDGEGKDEGLIEGASRASCESSSIEESSSPSLSSEVSSDEESAASDEEDHAREISELETLIANAEADKLAELEEKEELSRQLTTRKHEFESMPTAMEREARLVDKINEVKRLHDARKAPVVDKAALERQAQEAKRLETAKQELQEQVQALEERLSQTQSDLQEISSSLEEAQDLLAMYSAPAAGGQVRKQRKTAANPRSGPRGDVGPLGDEAPEWEEENVPSRDAHGGQSSLSPREVRTLDEQREELMALFEKVYAPFQVDPDTGDRLARVRSHAVVVRSERLGDVLVRKEGSSIAGELEALRCDSLKVVSIRNEIQADVERATSQLQDALARGSNGSSQEEEIQRRLVAASKQVALLGNQVSRDRAKANTQRHSIQTSHEEELRAALDDMEEMGKEVLSLKERVTAIAHEAAERASHNDRAQDLLRRQQAVHRKLHRQVTRLREEVRLNAADNPSQRATRVKRQIKALELANIKLHRKLRDLESQLQRKQIQARKRAEARQAAIRAGREVEPPNEADQLFRDDDETRARKADLRKQIGKSMRQLSRWRRRWQAAKRAASLATSARQRITRPPLSQSQRSTDADSSSARKYRTGNQHIQSQQHAGFLMQDDRQQHQHQQQSQTFFASTSALGGRQVLNDGCGAVAVEVRRPSLTTAPRQLAAGPEAHRAMAAVAAKLDAQRRSSLSASSNDSGLGILSVSTRPLGSPTARSRGSPRQQKMLRSSSPQQTPRAHGEKRHGSIALPTYKSPRRSLLQTLPTSLYNDTRKPRSPERNSKANNKASHAPGSGSQLYSKPLQGQTSSEQVRGFIHSEQVRSQVDKKRVPRLPGSKQVRVQLPARETKNQTAELLMTSDDSRERPMSPPFSDDELLGKSSSSPTNGGLLGWMEPVNIDLASRLGLN